MHRPDVDTPRRRRAHGPARSVDPVGARVGHDGVVLRRSGRDRAGDVREISLPAGRYFLLASIARGTLDTDEQEATCSLAVGYGGNVTATLDTATAVVPYPHGGVTRPSPIVLQGAVYYTQPGFARLKCSLFRGLIGGSCTALQVGSISGQ